MIRKIIIGRDPKNAMAYYTGMRVGDAKITAIIVDEEHLYKHGRTRYLIYIENPDGIMLWKGVDSMPVIVEYDLNLDFS